MTIQIQNPKVGDFYEGGVVFYILQDGDAGYDSGETHGLIAALKNHATTVVRGF